MCLYNNRNYIWEYNTLKLEKKDYKFIELYYDT